MDRVFLDANVLFSAISGGKRLGPGNYAVEIAVESRLSNEGVQDFEDGNLRPDPVGSTICTWCSHVW